MRRLVVVPFVLMSVCQLFADAITTATVSNYFGCSAFSSSTGDFAASVSGSCTFPDQNGFPTTFSGTASGSVLDGVNAVLKTSASAQQTEGEMRFYHPFANVTSVGTATLNQTFVVVGGTGTGILDAHFDLGGSADEDTGSTAFDLFNGIEFRPFPDPCGPTPLPPCIQSLDVTIPFSFGVPFLLSATLTSQATQSGDGASATAEADLSSLMALDANGNPISGAVIVAVSEPGMLLPLFCFFVIVLYKLGGTRTIAIAASKLIRKSV